MSSPSEDLAAQVKRAFEKKVGGKAVAGGKDKGGVGCFALVDQVLKSLGAKTAADFVDLTLTSDYVWGESVKLESVQPGYILQFRDHTIKIRTETLGEFKWEVTSEELSQKRSHHTAVVVEVQKEGSVVLGVVLVEQNVKPNPNKITRNVLPRLAEGTETRYSSNTVRSTITVTGFVKAYRPVPKPKGATLFRPDEKPAANDRRMLAYFIPSEGGPRQRPGPVGMG